jgi:peptidoglycan pentaglycine glycine transferase (the first glycine)
MTELDLSLWNEYLQKYPQAHILQTGVWGELKSGFGWYPVRVANQSCGAQILFRRLPAGFTIAYIPKGPVGENWQSLWPDVDRICRREKAVFLKVEPDAWSTQTETFLPQLKGFQVSRPIQPPRTVVISLEGSEENWLARMKQKTRYNIRLAEKKDIVIRASSNLTGFEALMRVTGERDGFGVHSLDYYQRAYDLFHPTGMCELLTAEYDSNLLAALMVFQTGKRAWYLYGASSNEERNRMPTYLLQWEAMRWAASHGCTEYDLWGVPDEDEETLEAQFEQRSDGLWGVYRFKRGFGGSLLRASGAWDRIYRPWLYQVYQLMLGRRGDGG